MSLCVDQNARVPTSSQDSMQIRKSFSWAGEVRVHAIERAARVWSKRDTKTRCKVQPGKGESRLGLIAGHGSKCFSISFKSLFLPGSHGETRGPSKTMVDRTVDGGIRCQSQEERVLSPARPSRYREVLRQQGKRSSGRRNKACLRQILNMSSRHLHNTDHVQKLPISTRRKW